MKKQQPPVNKFKTIPNRNPVVKQRKVPKDGDKVVKEVIDAYACVDFITKDYLSEQIKIKNYLKEQSYNTYIEELIQSGQVPKNPKLEGFISNMTACIRKRSKASGISDDEAKLLHDNKIDYFESIPDLKVVASEPQFELGGRDDDGQGFFFNEAMRKKIEKKLLEIKDPELQQALKENKIFSPVMEDDNEVYVSKKIITEKSFQDLAVLKKIKKVNPENIREILNVISNFSISPINLNQEYKEREKALEVLLGFEKKYKGKR